MLKGLNKVSPDSQGLIWPLCQPSQHRVNMEPQANFISSISENTIICSPIKHDIDWNITSPSAVANLINNFTINHNNLFSKYCPQQFPSKSKLTQKKNKYWRHSVLKQPQLLNQVQIIHMQDKTYTELNNIHIKNTQQNLMFPGLILISQTPTPEVPKDIPSCHFRLPPSWFLNPQFFSLLTKIYLNQSPIFFSIFRRKSLVYPRSPWTLDDNSEFLCPSQKIESNATQFPRWPSYTTTMAAIFKQQPSNDIRQIFRQSFDIKFC